MENVGQGSIVQSVQCVMEGLEAGLEVLRRNQPWDNKHNDFLQQRADARDLCGIAGTKCGRAGKSKTS